MLTASDLPQDLAELKKALGVPLIKFEDAKVELGKSEKIWEKIFTCVDEVQ